MRMLSYAELLGELDAAVEWLAKLGITKRNRISQHQSNIRMLVQAEKAGQLEQLRKELEPRKIEEIFWSWTESFEFVDVASSLRDADPAELLPVLRKAVQGPANPATEEAQISSNDARNIMFELVIAARLTRAGLRTSLQEPDVVANLDDWRFLIACKRPLSDVGIKRNVAAAGLQLRRGLQKEKHARSIGLVALSVSKVLNPGKKILEVQRRSDLSEALGEHVGGIWQTHKNSFLNLSEKRIAGGLLHLVTPTAIIGEKAHLTSSIMQVYSFRGSEEVHEILKYLEYLMRTTALQEQRK